MKTTILKKSTAKNFQLQPDNMQNMEKFTTCRFKSDILHLYLGSKTIFLHKPMKSVHVNKTWKNVHNLTLQLPINRLLVLSKVFGKILTFLRPILEHNKLIPNHQFGFRETYGIVKQEYRFVQIVRNTWKKRTTAWLLLLTPSSLCNSVSQ